MISNNEHTITYQKGMLTIKPERTSPREVAIIVGIIFFIPIVFSALVPIVQTIFVSVLWCAVIGHLSVGRMRLQSIITIDTEQKTISCEPLYPNLRRSRVFVEFSNIKAFEFKPIIAGSRYTPLGKRLKLVRVDDSKVVLLDCTSAAEAVKIHNILSTIVHLTGGAVKSVTFDDKDFIVLEVCSEYMNYIVYRSLLDGDSYFISILESVSSSLSSVVKIFNKQDVDKMLRGSKEVRNRIVDSYR